jgi:hypothetical protein
MILTILFSQRTDKFNEMLQEIFGKTKASQIIAQKILNKAYSELDVDDFEELMVKKQTETDIIADNYFLPEEL